MDYPKFVLSNQKEEYISIQRIKVLQIKSFLRTDVKLLLCSFAGEATECRVHVQIQRVGGGGGRGSGPPWKITKI